MGCTPFYRINNEALLKLTNQNDIAHQGEQLAKQEHFDLVLLDIMLPQKDGFPICSTFREYTNIPILFVSAKQNEIDKIKGLGCGANDYIVKPYTVRNVIARVKTVLRRFSGYKESNITPEKPNILQVNGLQLNLEFKRCIVDGVEVKMAKKELELLAYLIQQRGKICSREEILSRVWSDEVVVLDRTIDVNITRVRQKIGPYGSYIVTRSGFGYGFSD